MTNALGYNALRLVSVLRHCISAAYINNKGKEAAMIAPLPHSST